MQVGWARAPACRPRLGEVEDVVDQGQQMFAALLDGGQAIGMTSGSNRRC